MSATPLIAQSVVAGYPGQRVLEGIDLEITPGMAPLGLLGESGAGKTTLVDVLAGAIRPSAGQVTWRGRNVSRIRGRDKKGFRAAVRFVSQYEMTILDPRETVANRLDRAAKEARKGGRTHGISAADMLASVGLGPQYLTRTMRTLSGGETQRVALATALATRPEILVLDEPLTAVDPNTRAELAAGLRATIERLGIGVLLASHDLELLQRLCPQIAYLGQGRILARGSLGEVLSHTEHEQIRDLAIANPLAVQRFR